MKELFGKTILVVGENPHISKLLQMILGETYAGATVTLVQSIIDMNEAIKDSSFDVIVLDLGLSRTTPDDEYSLRIDTPVVALTTRDDNWALQRLTEMGYTGKPFIVRQPFNTQELIETIIKAHSQ